MLTNLPKTNDSQAITLMALKEANEKHPPVFNSTHEGYAVLKEELEECQDALSAMFNNYYELWRLIKQDADWATLSTQLTALQPKAYELITEAAHASAMVMKLHAYIRTQIAKKENEDM